MNLLIRLGYCKYNDKCQWSHDLASILKPRGNVDTPFDDGLFEMKCPPGAYLFNEDEQDLVTYRQFEAILEGFETFVPNILFHERRSLVRARELLKSRRFGELGVILAMVLKNYKPSAEERRLIAEVLLNANSVGVSLLNQTAS